MKVYSVLAFASYATAFAPMKQGPMCTSLDMSLKDMAGATMPFPGFDPLGLGTLGSESTLAWFRAAEMKNGRVAMLATTGYLVQAAGIHFPGMLSSDVSFESLSTMKPFDAWTAVPAEGQAQIIGTIFLAELITESKGTHYTKGGELPRIVFPPVDFAENWDADKLKEKQSKELNNGRLAMIGIMSFVAAANIPGSVPLLDGNPMF